MDTLSATESYLSLYLSLPNLQPITVLSVLFLTVSRLLPVLTLAPFLGAKNLPMAVRMMFALALTAIFLPQNLLQVKREIFFDIAFVGLMMKELIIGFVLGFFASVPFFVAQMAGSLIDHQRGTSSLQVTDPTTQSQTGSIGIFYNYVLIALFMSIGGIFFFFDGVATSYKLIPVDQIINADLFHLNAPFWKKALHTMEYVFDLSIQLSAPALIGVLLTDMFLGIANRLASQVQIVFLGMPLKSWVGIALLAASWALVIQVMGKEAINWMKAVNQMITQVGPYAK